MKEIIKLKKLYLFFSIMFVFIFFMGINSNVNAETKAFEKFTNLQLKSSFAAAGDKVYVDLFANIDQSDDIKINLISDGFKADLQDVKSGNPYFVIPKDTPEGNYRIYYIWYKDNNGAIMYATSEGLPNYTNCNGKNQIYVKRASTEDQTTLSTELLEFTITGDTSNVKIGDKIPVKVKTQGQVSRISASFYNEENNQTIATSIKDFDTDNAYINVSSFMGKECEGTFELKTISVYTNSSSYIIYKKNPNNSTLGNAKLKELTFTGSLTVKGSLDETTNASILNSISLNSSIAIKNEKVSVNLDTTVKCEKVMLLFENEAKNKNMTVYLQNLSTTPYFTIPYTAENDNYNLYYAMITDKSGNVYHFSKEITDEKLAIQKYDFNSVIKVIEESTDAKETITEENILYLDNDKITTDIVADIMRIKDDLVITIDANKNTFINSGIFSAIKGTNKSVIIKYNNNEWIFNGMDITNPKSIDVGMNLDEINLSTDEFLNMALEKGILLNFPSNGDLPGKVLIRIKATEEMKEYLGTETAYVYYYDENGLKLDKVAVQIRLTSDGYYEFYINHNSKFILTSTEANSGFVSNDTADLALNDSSIESNSTQTSVSTTLENSSYNSIIRVVVIITAVIIFLIIFIFIINRIKMAKN